MVIVAAVGFGGLMIVIGRGGQYIRNGDFWVVVTAIELGTIASQVQMFWMFSFGLSLLQKLAVYNALTPAYLASLIPSFLHSRFVGVVLPLLLSA